MIFFTFFYLHQRLGPPIKSIVGWASAARSSKATRLLTAPRCEFKSSAKDLVNRLSFRVALPSNCQREADNTTSPPQTCFMNYTEKAQDLNCYGVSFPVPVVENKTHVERWMRFWLRGVQPLSRTRGFASLTFQSKAITRCVIQVFLSY